MNFPQFSVSKNLQKSIFAALLLTAASLPSQAQNSKPRFVGCGQSGGTGDVFLVGGFSQQRGWFSDSTARQLLVSGARWNLFDIKGKHSEARTGKVQEGDGVGGLYAEGLAKPSTPNNISDAANVSKLALANVPNAQPRLPRALNVNQPVYVDAMTKLLRGQGLKNPKARLSQLLQVDLNGDGRNEVLMSAKSRPDFGQMPSGRAGDYSVTALRYVEGGRVKTIPLAAEIYKKTIDFAAPNHFEVLSCADINGDGRMEIVISTGYYEGWGLEVWTFDGRKVARVLGAGWGA